MGEHILIIGGTGMLYEASVALAERCAVLTSVARTERSLNGLDAALNKQAVVHHMLALNWLETATFLDSLVSHVRRVGHPSLVLAWLHQDELGPKIAVALAPMSGTCDFYQVRGSAAADPAANAPTFASVDTIPRGICFRQVILGFHAGSGGSRWLTNAEISAGVLAAIDTPRSITIVGKSRP